MLIDPDEQTGTRRITNTGTHYHIIDRRSPGAVLFCKDRTLLDKAYQNLVEDLGIQGFDEWCVVICGGYEVELTPSVLIKEKK